MDLSLTISNRQIVPAVVNVYQYENDTNVMKFTLDGYMYGEVDLRNYTPYVITSQNGLIDYTEAEMNYDATEDVVTLTWNIQEYSVREQGAVLYQICFKESTASGEVAEGENTAVFYSYKAIVINRGSIDGDDHLTANYPTLLKQWLDKMNATKEECIDYINDLAGDFNASVVYIPYGETIAVEDRLENRLYYQYTDVYNVTGRFEDYEGNILIDNQSLTAVELQPNVDLNDIRESGVYYTSLNTNAATMLNTPIKEAFYLEVISIDENLTKQVWTHFNTTVGDIYTRKYYRGTWGEWYKTATTKYVDGTFLPLTGGNLKGALDLGKYNIANVSSIEMMTTSDSNHGGFIDFHYNGNAKDFTSRIMENAEGRIEVIAPNGIRCNNKQLVRTVGGVEADGNGNVDVVAYDNMSFSGTTLTLSRTNDTSSSVDLGDKFVDLTSNQTVGGVKTLTSAPNLSYATALRVPMIDNDKNLVSSGITTTELGYMNGLTSNIQTQLNGKQAAGSYVTLANAQTISGVKTFSTSPKVPTVASTINDTTAASCQWVNNKHKVVSALPSSPDANTFYYIPE